jgi:GGDEF domain-containing protein
MFVSKITTAQAEIQRIVKMEEQPQHRSQGDVLTGLPNRAQFLERLSRVVQYVIDLDASNPSMIDSGIRRATSSFVMWRDSFKAV